MKTMYCILFLFKILKYPCSLRVCLLPGTAVFIFGFYLYLLFCFPCLFFFFLNGRNSQRIEKPRFNFLHPPNRWVAPSHFRGPRSCFGTCSSGVGAISWRHDETDLIRKKEDQRRRRRRSKNNLCESHETTSKKKNTQNQNPPKPKQHAFVFVPPNSRVVMTSMTVVLPSFCAAQAWRNASPTWSMESTVTPSAPMLRATSAKLGFSKFTPT